MRALVAAALVLAGAAAAQTLAERQAACGACHGVRGISENPEFPSLAGQPRTFLALQLILFREGLRDVPAMNAAADGLSDAEVEALADHFAALPPPAEAPPRDEARAARGAALAERLRCGVCHRPDYAGAEQVPRLARQHEAYLRATLIAYRDGHRRGTDTSMNAAVYGLSEGALEDLAHFLATLRGP